MSEILLKWVNWRKDETPKRGLCEVDGLKKNQKRKTKERKIPHLESAKDISSRMYEVSQKYPEEKGSILNIGQKRKSKAVLAN